MFLSRNDVLDQLIELYNSLEFSNTHNLMDDRETRELHCPIVSSFVFNEIEDFTKTIIEDLLEIELFDFEFANKVYEFEQAMFEKKIKSAIKHYLRKFDFKKVLLTVASFKYDLQAIMGYEAIFEHVYDPSKDTKESYDLSQKLQDMIAKPLFSQITADKQTRLTNMACRLPVHPNDLEGTRKLVITNLGNKLYLNVEMVRQEPSPVVFPGLTFDSNEMEWTLHRSRDDHLFEIESPLGQLLCWVKPLPSLLGRIIAAETIFMDRSEAKNTKWEIEYLVEGDPCRGFIIKAAGLNIYLSGARTGDFSAFVDVLKTLDSEQPERGAWKFHRIEYK